VESFVYFGTVLNSDGGVMMEIKARLGAANKCCFGLINPFSSKLLSRRVKCIYTGCPRRSGQNFGRVFLRLNYTDITQNTYIQS